MVLINEENFKREIEDFEGLALVDFYAEWCGPCTMIAPVLTELEREMTDVKFCKVNIDENPELIKIFRVESIPYLALVKDNTFLDMLIGYKTKSEIINFIAENK